MLDSSPTFTVTGGLSGAGMPPPAGLAAGLPVAAGLLAVEAVGATAAGAADGAAGGGAGAAAWQPSTVTRITTQTLWPLPSTYPARIAIALSTAGTVRARPRRS